MTSRSPSSPSLTSTPQRDAQLARLGAEPFDVLVCGAGINGAVSAAALAAAGARVALVDKGDFGGFTSQESSNLVWGGIKYLEGLEVRLVRKLCRARNELLASYPENVHEVRFLLSPERRPAGWNRRLPFLYLGTWVYWLFGSMRTRTPRYFSNRGLAHHEPAIDGERARGAVEYSDAYLVDGDARFVWGFVRRALAGGACAVNYAEVEGLERRGDEWRASVVDHAGGGRHEVRARCLVNACGPFADGVNALGGNPTDARHVLSKGIHLVVDRIPREERVLAFFDDTERLFFVIPMGLRSAIGTTDTPVDEPVTEVTEEDRDFLLEQVNRRLRRERPLTRADVISERCGVRPLAIEGGHGDGAREWLSLSRKHVIETSRERRALTIFGGKLTDCLNVGAEVCDVLRGLGLELRDPGRWYGEPGAEERARAMEDLTRAGLNGEDTARLWRRYGTAATEVADLAATGGLGAPWHAPDPLLAAELAWMGANEMVVAREDLLRRRTQLVLQHRAEDLPTDLPAPPPGH